MKDLINILLIIILTGFVIALTKILLATKIYLFGWLYVPLFVLILMFADKLDRNY